eukprot:GEMP01049756.1.p1 GENE.GEMP01049756.1~~GEMP01049756.1.p1  ORF type:complete len:391 (+),score=84.16 GEMP01049756.1:96-1175(+)
MATVRGLFLGGQCAVFEDCATVGDIMVSVAREQARFASDVVVLPVGSGEVLTHDRVPPPDVAIVMKKQEGRLCEDECKTSIKLHTAVGDVPTVARALTMLEDASPGTAWAVDFLLDEARDAEKENAVRTLLRAGVKGGDGLLRASEDGETGAVQRLLQAGVSVNSGDGKSNSALMIASGEGHNEMAQVLLEAGADINFVDRNGMGALMLASGQGHKETAQVLLEAEADVNLVGQHGVGALMIASMQGHKDMAHVLLEAGADVNLVAQHSMSALMMASEEGDNEMVQVLVEAGADVNFVDQNGMSALTIASREGREEVKQILLSAGAVYLAGQPGYYSYKLREWTRPLYAWCAKLGGCGV